VEAMRTNQKVKIAYHPFEAIPYEVVISPLVLKVFKQRWYVVGESDMIKLYSLGRIDSCEISSETFKLNKNFNPEKFFEFTYGVTIGDDKQKPLTIKIKAGYQRHYLKELPLHESQEETDIGVESIFTYFLKPSNEFIMELLSYGDGIEVLEPESLRDEIVSRIERMNIKYN
jgi:predicted DNA-binding transcriptional regulator YafY